MGTQKIAALPQNLPALAPPPPPPLIVDDRSLNVDFLKKKMTTGLKEVTLFSQNEQLRKETWTKPCDSWC